MNPLLTGLGSNLFYEMGSKRGQSENGLMGYRCMLKNVMYIYNFFQKFSPKWKPYMYNPGFFIIIIILYLVPFLQLHMKLKLFHLLGKWTKEYEIWLCNHIGHKAWEPKTIHVFSNDFEH